VPKRRIKFLFDPGHKSVLGSKSQIQARPGSILAVLAGSKGQGAERACLSIEEIDKPAVTPHPGRGKVPEPRWVISRIFTRGKKIIPWVKLKTKEVGKGLGKHSIEGMRG